MSFSDLLMNPGGKRPVPVTVRWSSAQAEDRFAVENPATGAAIAMVQGGGVAQVDSAVRTANNAYESDWRWRTPQERGAYLLKCAVVLEQHADELAALESLENGKPVSQARQFDVAAAIGLFRFFGSLADKMPGEFFDTGNILSTVILEPYGVIGAIIPFNWPPIHTAGKLAPALAAGNTVVLKPGEQAPLTAMRMVELIEGVLPRDVVHVVPGCGPTAGQALAAHPLVRKVSFTGSTRVGSAVLKSAADNITPALVELGGKNAFLVFDDADLDRAARDALEGAYFNQGEACTAASRILVQRPVYEEFVKRLSAGVSKLVVGDGADAATHVGPLVTREHQRKVLEYLRIGQEEGAIIVAQAPLSSSKELAGGFFVQPTLFRDVRTSMRIFREEMFGPIATVTPFDSFEEAVAITNASPYGLLAGVYTKDSQLAYRAARKIDVGAVLINNYNRNFLGTAPFGGTKHSGYGREHYADTLRQFCRFKAIRAPSGSGPIPNWGAVDQIYGTASQGQV